MSKKRFALVGIIAIVLAAAAIGGGVYFFNNKPAGDKWIIEGYGDEFHGDTRLVRIDRYGNREVVINSTEQLLIDAYPDLISGISLVEIGNWTNPKANGNQLFLESVPNGPGPGAGWLSSFFSYNINSGKLTMLTHQPEYIGEISPDGLKYAFMSKDFHKPELTPDGRYAFNLPNRIEENRLEVIFLDKDIKKIITKADGINETFECYEGGYDTYFPGELSWVDNETIKYSVCDPKMPIDYRGSSKRPVIAERIVNINTQITSDYLATINLDAKTYTDQRNSWRLESKIGSGIVTVEKKADGELYIAGKKVVLYLSPNQQNGKIINGLELRKELQTKSVLNANILDYLLAHPDLIPDSWKGAYPPPYIAFWGSVYRDSSGKLRVPFLWYRGDNGIDANKWSTGDFGIADNDFGGGSPAAILADSTTTVSSPRYTTSTTPPASTDSAGQDSQRLSDLNSLNSLLAFYISNGNQISCVTGKIYTSMSGNKAIDGTGWIPFNFNKLQGGSPLKELPIDPINSSSAYYSFACDQNTQTYEFDAKLSSSKYMSYMKNDGGSNPELYEIGSNPGLTLIK